MYLNHPAEFFKLVDQKINSFIEEAIFNLDGEFQQGFMYSLAEIQDLLNLRQRILFREISGENNPIRVERLQKLVNDAIEIINSLRYAQSEEDLSYKTKFDSAFTLYLDNFNMNNTDPTKGTNMDELFFGTL
jgi:hypothetical protein